MKCINCESEWNATGKTAASITTCPFCGESPVVKKAEQKSFDNSKQALEAIYKQFGVDILLGKLTAYIADFAPSLSTANKRLVNTVYELGAAKALKENINGSQEDKERAIKIAIRTLTEAFVAPEMAEKIVYEFSNALGWEINKTVNHSIEKNEHSKKEIETKTSVPKKTKIKSEDKKPSKKNLIAKAEEGDADSQCDLGNCYLLGINGFPFDQKIGFEWFQKAAEQGNAVGQNQLGNCYYLGAGVQKNYAIAAEWWQKAAVQGIKNAKDMLDQLKKESKI